MCTILSDATSLAMADPCSGCSNRLRPKCGAAYGVCNGAATDGPAAAEGACQKACPCVRAGCIGKALDHLRYAPKTGQFTGGSTRVSVFPALAILWFSWYGLRMETTPFDLTPAQKGLLEALARETGKAIPSLLDEALEGLAAHVRQRADNGARHGRDEGHAAPPPLETPKPI